MRDKRNNKAVSVIVGYILTLSVAFLLISSSILITENVVSNSEESSLERQLNIISNNIAKELDTSARISQDSNSIVIHELKAYSEPLNYEVLITGDSVIVQTENIQSSTPLSNARATDKTITFRSGQTKTLKVNKNGQIEQ